MERLVNMQDEQEEPKSERFNMFISKSELDAIDAWSWDRRIRSKSEAVRRLIKIALAYEAKFGELHEVSKLMVDANQRLQDRVEEFVKKYEERGVMEKNEGDSIVEDLTDSIVATANFAVAFTALREPIHDYRSGELNGDLEGLFAVVDKIVADKEFFQKKFNARLGEAKK